MDCSNSEEPNVLNFCIHLQGENEYTVEKKLHILLECKGLLKSPILAQFYPLMRMQCTDCLMRNQSLKMN